MLNPTKTETLVSGSGQQIAKFDRSHDISVSQRPIPIVEKIRVLGITLKGQLSLGDHITGVVRPSNYHLRAFCHIRPVIKQDLADTVACFIACSRLDYCNSILYGITELTMDRLQRVQNSLAHVFCAAPHMATTASLWRPVQDRVDDVKRCTPPSTSLSV